MRGPRNASLFKIDYDWLILVTQATLRVVLVILFTMPYVLVKLTGGQIPRKVWQYES